VTSLLLSPATAYLAVFVLVGLESMGVPLPGETSLIAASVLAAHGTLSLALVIGAAAAGAIVGDNGGYVLGRQGARRLLDRPGRWERQREQLVERGERFFRRYGGKAVFLGRWVTGVRLVIAWLAGANRYPWPQFLAWNAAGGICWAVSIAILAFVLGAAAARVLTWTGVGAAAVIVVVAAGVWLRRRRR
jgi:membrane protein DedA with SNARE-associated domain